MLGSTEKMFEVGEINGGGPGEKLLGSRKSIGGAKEIKGSVGAAESIGMLLRCELQLSTFLFVGG